MPIVPALINLGRLARWLIAGLSVVGSCVPGMGTENKWRRIVTIGVGFLLFAPAPGDGAMTLGTVLPKQLQTGRNQFRVVGLAAWH